MKTAPLAVLLAFILLLASCTGKQTETAFPAEKPDAVQDVPSTPQDSGGTDTLPSIPADPGEAVLAYVDMALQTESPHLSCWFSRGSGPLLIDIEGYQDEIRAAFAQLAWHSLESSNDEAELAPADWSFSLSHGNKLNLRGGTGSDVLTVYVHGDSGTERHFFHAEGAASLPFALADLYDGPYIRYCLAEVPESAGTNDRALAEAFAATFEKDYLASGAVSAFQLQTLTVSDNTEDNLWRCFRMAFAVKPTDPASPCWQEFPPDNDGWVFFENELALYLDEDAIWRCDWFQA